MSNYSFSHTITPRENSNDQLLIDVLNGLLERYINRVPDAQRIIELITNRGDQIINDHIAFRSIYIESILTIFLHLGFEVKMDLNTNRPFNFEEKKLTAVWLKHPNKDVPRIFVSQFRFDEGSEILQETVNKYLEKWSDPIDSVNLNDANSINNYLHTAQWPTPTYKDYKNIQSESEYLSWVLYNKYYLNHFTLTVHELHSFNFEDETVSILQAYQDSYQKQKSDSVISDALNMLHAKYEKHFREFNTFLEDNEFNMNSKNNETLLNISPDKTLLQSSTKSKMICANFDEGEFEIPGSYVEFAYRGLDDQAVKKLLKTKSEINIKEIIRRDGFETKNADKIFESTYIGKELKDASNIESSYEKSCKALESFLAQFNA